MGFWIAIILFVGLTAANQLLRPRLKRPREYPNASGDVQYPTIQERPIPLLFGCTLLRGPNVTWYGDYSATDLGGGVFAYKAGMQWGLCGGELTPVLSQPFLQSTSFGIFINETKLAQYNPTVDSSHNQIRFGNGSIVTATLPVSGVGAYFNPSDLAAAAQLAMRTAQPGYWRVLWCNHITLSPLLTYALTIAGVTTSYDAQLFDGWYVTGDELAAEIQRALNAAEQSFHSGSLGSFAVSYSTLAHKFTITFAPSAAAIASGYTGWILKGVPFGTAADATNIKPMLGFQMDTDKLSSGNSVVSDYQVDPYKFAFAFGGSTGTLKLSDAAFTAKALFGLTSSTDATINQRNSDGIVATGEIAWYSSYGGIRAIADIKKFLGTNEGTVSGIIYLYPGNLFQPADEYLATQVGPTANWYRIAHAVARGMNFGTTSYPKPIGFELCHHVAGPGGHDIIFTGGPDSNPASIIYWLLTDPIFGLGIPTTAIDSASFAAAATTLYTEGNGMSFLLDRIQEVWETIHWIEKHVDALVTQDASTSLWKLILVRPGYDPADFPLVDDSVASDCTMTRRAWSELTNAVKIRYIDRSAGYVEKVEQVQDLAGIEARGGAIDVEEVDLTGFTSATPARAAGNRMLRGAGLPLAQLEITVNRSGWDLRPGSIFRFSWPEFGLSELACRVTGLRAGELTNGQITVEAVEDVFGQ